MLFVLQICLSAFAPLVIAGLSLSPCGGPCCRFAKLVSMFISGQASEPVQFRGKVYGPTQVRLYPLCRLRHAQQPVAMHLWGLTPHSLRSQSSATNACAASCDFCWWRAGPTALCAGSPSTRPMPA